MSDAIFHVVVQGYGWIVVDGGDGEPRAFRGGDLLVLPHGHGHTLRDHPASPVESMHELVGEPGADGLPCIRPGGSGPATSLLCGTFHLGPDSREVLLPFLPRLIHVRGGTPTAAWLDATLRVLADEIAAGRPGSSTVVRRLTDILFVQILRAWLDEGDDRPGWFAALRDPPIARAIGLLHDAPAERWTVEELARRVGMSRSSFFARFSARVGEGPAQYLTRWRMVLARQALRRGGRTHADIADSIGYASEAAFSRAFKRQVGRSPGVWQRLQGTSALG